MFDKRGSDVVGKKRKTEMCGEVERLDNVLLSWIPLNEVLI